MKALSLFTGAFALLLGATFVATAEEQRSPHDRASAGNIIRVSEMMGMNIHNPAGEDVGEVNDIVLDADSGQIRYAAVTYGGFLGVGDKMFAVPYKAFTCKASPDDPSERRLILDVTPEKLKGLTGFDEDHWPNFADRTFTDSVDRAYGVQH